jgi:hypothetical protein
MASKKVTKGRAVEDIRWERPVVSPSERSLKPLWWHWHHRRVKGSRKGPDTKMPFYAETANVAVRPLPDKPVHAADLMPSYEALIRRGPKLSRSRRGLRGVRRGEVSEICWDA